MIGITGFGTEITPEGPVNYIEVRTQSGERAKLPAPTEFIEAIMDFMSSNRGQYKAAAVKTRSKAPEPEPYVLQPDFEPPFPAVSQAPRGVSKVAEAPKAFSAKNLLANAFPPRRYPEPTPTEPRQQSAPRKLVTTLPPGEFLHFPDE